jgi:DNA polymerase-3 subunit delta
MFYLFHGDDPYSQQETLAGLTERLGDPAMLELNTTQFDGRLPSVAELRQACDSVPFLAPARLVIFHDIFQKRPAETFIKELLDYLPNLPETTRLVFLESRRLPKNHRLVKLADSAENGFVKQFEAPQGSALERWVRQQVKVSGGKIEPFAAQMLAANVGNDLQTLSVEIEKLVLYKNSEGSIDVDDVALLSPYAAEANIFDLVDALGNRSGKQAAQLLQKKLTEGADPFYLFSMFVRQFRLIIQVKSLVMQEMHAPAIAQRLNMHSFVAGKIYQQSKQFTLEQLKQIYQRLLEMDVQVKTGQEDMTTALYLLVAGIAGS